MDHIANLFCLLLGGLVLIMTERWVDWFKNTQTGHNKTGLSSRSGSLAIVYTLYT